LVAALALGCVPKGDADTAHDAAAVPHPADAHWAASKLPATALAFALVADPKALIELGRSQLEGSTLQAWERAAFAITSELGHNLLSPEVLHQLGVDVSAPTAIALLPAEREPVVAVGFTLRAPERFKSALYRALGDRRRLRPDVVDRTVIVGDDDMAIMLEGVEAIALFGRGAKERAVRLATLEVDASLARHRPFRIAMGPQAPDRDVRGYVDLRALAYLAAGMDPRWAGETLEDARRDASRTHRDALAAARARGAGVDEMVTIDDELSRAPERLRDDWRAAGLRAVLGGIDGVAFALSLKPDAIDLEVSFEARGGTWLRRALVHRVPPDLAAGEALGLSAFVSLDPKEWDATLRHFGVAEELAAELGLDGGSEGLFGGVVAVAALLPRGGLAALTRASDLRWIAVASIGDAARVESILKRLAERSHGELRVEGDHWRIESDGAALSLFVAKDRIVLASDEADRARTMAAPLAPAAGADAAADFRLTLGLPLMARSLRTSAAPPPALVAPPWHDPELQKSAAYEAKLDELRAVDRALAELLDSGALRAARQRAALLEPLGTLHARVTESEHGAAVRLRYRSEAPNAIAAIGDAIEQLDALTAEPDARELSALSERRASLEAELEAIYETLASGGR
jgi:hypothetical protein